MYLLGTILVDAASANVVLSPSDASTRLGHTLLLPCVVVTGDNSTAVHVTWQHNGVDIGATPHFQVHTPVTPQRSGTTIIKSVLDVCVTATDVAGNYSCTAVAGESILDQEAFRIHVEPAHGESGHPIDSCMTRKRLIGDTGIVHFLSYVNPLMY